MDKIQIVQRHKMKICDSITLDSGVTIPVIMGQCSEVEVVSQNGYYYKSDFWRKVLGQQSVRDAIENRDMFGMIEHPQDDDAYLKTPYDKASHIVLKAWVDDYGNPFAQFGLLDNEQGNNIKALIQVGHRPGVSSRGLGEMANDEKGTYVTDDGYAFITWDIVRSPNFSELKLDKVTDSLRATPLFRELVQMNHLKDSADEHYSKANLEKDMTMAINALTRIRDNMFNNTNLKFS